MHPLEGFILKFNRAGEHFEGVRGAVERFVQSDFYETVAELDRKRRLVARLKNVKQPPPELSLLIGDTIHNLRSALDHLAYALASAHTNPLPDAFAKTSAFPIFATGPLFRAERGRGAAPKMRGMSGRTRAAIERLQPYHRRKHPRLEFLWMLEELSNIDKHRLVHLTSASMAGSSYRVSGTGMLRLEKVEVIAGRIKENAVVARFYGEFWPPPAVKVESNVIPDVVFNESSEARSARGLPVIDTLEGIRAAIVMDVIPGLAKELRRLFPGIKFDVLLGPGRDHRRHDQRGYA